MLVLLLPSLLLLLLLRLLLLLLLNHLLLLPCCCCCCERVELPVHGLGGVWAHHTQMPDALALRIPQRGLASCFFCFVLRALASSFCVFGFWARGLRPREVSHKLTSGPQPVSAYSN